MAETTTTTTPTKLTDSDARNLKNRVQLAERYVEKEQRDKWDRALQLYKGEHFKDLTRARQDNAVVVNYLLHVAETKVCSIAFRYPEFTVLPLTAESRKYVDIANSALRYEWRMSKVQREARRALKDKEIFGTGVVYNGWLFETQDGMRIEDGRQPVEGEDKDKTPDPDAADEGTTPIPVEEVRTDRFYCKRISPMCFLVDPECGRILDDAEYCGYWELRPLTEVKKNPHFKNTKNLKGTTANLQNYFTGAYRNLAVDDVPSDVKRVKLYHYYERNRRLHVIFCDEHDKPLYIGNWNWETDSYPFRVLQAPGDEDIFFGMSPLLMVEAPQMEMNEARSQLRRHRRMSVPHFWTRTGNMTRQAREQIKSCIPLGIVETNGDPINAIPRLDIQPEVYQTEQRALQDIQTISATDQYQMGRPPTKRATEGEVHAIQSLGGARSQDDRQGFEEFCAEIALDCLNWLRQYSTKTRTLPIYDTEGNIRNYFPDFTGDQIKGEFDIEVFVNSTTAPNNADILQGMAFWTQSFPPFLQSVLIAAQNGIDLTDLVRETLKVIPGIRNVDKIMDGFHLPIAPPNTPPGASPGGSPGAPPGGPPGMPPGIQGPPGAGLPPPGMTGPLPGPPMGPDGRPDMSAPLDPAHLALLQHILSTNR